MRLLTRALPLQLALVVFLFINTEAWQVADALWPGQLAVVVVFFGITALAFCITQVPREVQAIDVDLSEGHVDTVWRATPLARLAQIIDVPAMRSDPLGRRERLNLVLTLVVAQGLRILSLGLLMFVSLVVFGSLAIQPSVIEAWVGHSLGDLALFGSEIPVIRRELIHVATVIGAFSALQFAVLAVTDTTYRAEFFDALVGELSDTLVAHEVYLAGLEQHELEPNEDRLHQHEGA